MMTYRLCRSQWITPAVQVRKMIQQTIHGGPMRHQSHRASSCQQSRKTGASSRTKIKKKLKKNSAVDNLKVLDTQASGDKFPSKAGPNYSIITFQITGQMKNFIIQHRLTQIAKVCRCSNASVTLYAKHFRLLLSKNVQH